MSSINIKDIEKEKYIQEVFEYLLENRSVTESEAEVEAKRIIDECIKGWRYAPKTFTKRIDRKIGKNIFGKYKKSKEKAKRDSDSEKEKRIEGAIDAITSKYPIKTDEKKLLRHKLRLYVDTFDFENPADWDALENLLIDSVALSRVNYTYLNDADTLKESELKNLENRRDKLSKRIMDWQKNLGIDRASRDDELSKQARDLASIARSLDEKLEKMDEDEINNLKEEVAMNRERLSRDPINIPKTIEQKIRVMEGSEKGMEPGLQKLVEEHKERLLKMEFEDKEEVAEEHYILPEGKSIG